MDVVGLFPDLRVYQSARSAWAISLSSIQHLSPFTFHLSPGCGLLAPGS